MLKQKVQDPTGSLSAFPVDDLRIDPARVEDIPDILRIERVSFPSPWTRSYFLHEIRRNPVAFVFVLRDRSRDRVAGFIDVWIVRGQAHINNIAVDPEYRNHGCGEILMRHALDLGREHACGTALLEVRASNGPALRLYARLGFRVVAELPAYYSNGENAFVLVVDIAGGGHFF